MDLEQAAELKVGDRIRWRGNGDTGKIVEIAESCIKVEWQSGGSVIYPLTSGHVMDAIEYIHPMQRHIDRENRLRNAN